EVSSKAGLAAKMMALMTEHEKASKSTEAKSKRLAEKDGTETADLEQQIRDIADELDGSWVEVEITAATPTQRREASEAGKDVEEQVVAAPIGRASCRERLAIAGAGAP